MKKLLLVVSTLIIILITSCSQQNNTVTTVEPIETPSQLAPAGSYDTITSNEADDSDEITLEDVKNIELPLKLVIDATGKLRGLPEGTDQVTIDNVKLFYVLAKERFSNSTIYYSKDPESEIYVLLAVSPNNKPKVLVVPNKGESMQYSDYPIDFYNEETGVFEVNGNYEDVSVSGKTWACIWKNHIPRLIANKVIVGQDSYYKYYFKNRSNVGDNPWVAIAGLDDKIIEYEASNMLNIDNYKIVDGNIQEKEADGWKEVSVPYEAGYISYVELHEGKMYGIDTADRAVVVRNEETGEWEKFDRPMGITTNYNYIFQIPSQFSLEEIAIGEITRLNENGKSVPWGVITKEQPVLYSSFAHVYISGYPLGTYDIEPYNDGRVFRIFVYEIPQKYCRQIISVFLNTKESNHGKYNEILSIPSSNNIMDRNEYISKGNEVRNILSNPDLRGKQIILGFQTNKCDIVECPQEELENDYFILKLIESIEKGSPATTTVSLENSKIWINEIFLPN